MPRLLSDTHPDAEAVQIAIYRAMAPWQKAALVADAMATSRALAMAGLRLRHPGASEAELQRRLMDLVLGEELAAKVYGPLEEILQKEGSA
ncbi:MAG TPA: hypothetical protein VF017_00580 [Thermoanaerobaculia bacterium]|nr:hypothetical protein [Thermoanaerobaculia bacterium]